MPNTDRPKKPLKHICFADIDGKESIVILAGGRDVLVAVAPIDDRAPGSRMQLQKINRQSSKISMQPMCVHFKLLLFCCRHPCSFPRQTDNLGRSHPALGEHQQQKQIFTRRPQHVKAVCIVVCFQAALWKITRL
jgi:hypothetical protein